ncbi:MAG: DUF1622 domain-containing protein [Bacteroidota bacterium]
MEAFRFIFLQRTANGVELLSAFVMLIGFAKAMWGYLWYEIQEMRTDETAKTEDISKLRLMVGRYILLGIDFYFISAFIAMMLRPEQNAFICLGLTGMLRIATGYFGPKEKV